MRRFQLNRVARTVDAATPIRRAISRNATNELQPKNFAHVAHDRSSLLASGLSFGTAKGADLSRPAGAPTARGEIIPEWWATSSRNGGRDHFGMVGAIIPESRAASPRNQQRDASTAIKTLVHHNSQSRSCRGGWGQVDVARQVCAAKTEIQSSAPPAAAARRERLGRFPRLRATPMGSE
jgi:hypothetical protein